MGYENYFKLFQNTIIQSIQSSSHCMLYPSENYCLQNYEAYIHTDKKEEIIIDDVISNASCHAIII